MKLPSQESFYKNNKQRTLDLPMVGSLISVHTDIQQPHIQLKSVFLSNIHRNVKFY